MTFGNIKKGAKVLVAHGLGGRRESVTEGCTVVSVGKKWITVRLGEGEYSKVKFDAETGYGDYDEHVHTEATLKDARERMELLSRINPIHWISQSTETLRGVVALLDSNGNLKE